MSRPSLGAAAVVALAAAILIPAVGAWQVMSARGAILADAEQSARTLSHSLAQHATRTIEGVDLLLSEVVERVQDGPDRLDLGSFLERSAKSLRQSHVVAVADARGKVIADSATVHAPLDIAERAYFIWERDHADPGLHIDSIVVSKVLRQPTIPLSRRIVSQDGSFAGLAVASLMPADFQQFYDSLEIGPHGTVALWTETGHVLVRRPAMPNFFVGQDHATGSLVTTFAHRDPEVLTVTSPFDGLKRIVAFETLDSYPLVVSVGISTDDALALWRAESAIQFIALALASAALVALAGVLERHGRARQALQDQVQAGADLLQATLESMEQGLIVVSADRSITISNRRADDLVAGDGGPVPSPNTEPRSLDHDRFDWLFSPAEAMGDGRVEYQVPDGPYLEIRRVSMPDGGALLTLSDITHLKRAEMETRATNRLLMMAEELAHLGHWRADLKSGRRTWSDEVFRIHDVPLGVGLPSREAVVALYHPDDRDRITSDLARAVECRESFEGHYRLLRPSGEVRHVLTRGRCETDPTTGEANGLFGVIMDVTALTRTQRDLGEATAHLRATLDHMDQGLIKVAPDGTIELSNRRFAELLNLPSTLLDAPATNFASIVHHPETHRGAEPFGDPLGWRNGSPTLSTDEREGPNGRILEIRTMPLPNGGMVRTYADITSRRWAEDAVRSSEAKYRMLADSTSDVITQLDLDFQRVYVSPASRAVFGYAPDEMLGRQPSLFIHPDDEAAVRTFAESIVAGAFPDDRGTTTYRFRHKKGHWIWIEAGLNLVREPTTGAPASVICSLRDVSERQRTARHLERAKAAAEMAARVKTEFLANMSHELRTPLTGILGIHDLLHNDSTLGRQQRRYLGLARDAGRSLLSIVNDVLDFTKMEAGQFSLEIVAFELGALIQSCRDLVQGDARRKSLRLETLKPDAPLHLMGDPTRLRQILLNLLTNAIKFTERGSVSTKASYDPATRRLHVAVSDTGIGLPRETLPLLFERFSQADASITRRYGGTGLGLAISKRLVDLMGGQIGVDSNLGAGSVFWFDVPLREAGSADRQPGSALSSAVPSRLRVLLAEDNDINQDIISAMLQQRGHAVTVVADGAAAVAAVRAGPRFAIILMDLQMPVMDGLSATRAIRAEETEASGPPTPIIGLTANAMAEDVIRCKDVGMDAHVAKPIDWSDLFATIERLTEAGPDLDVRGLSDPDPEVDVLDDTTLEALAGYIGRKRLEEMLGAFAREVEARVSGFDAATPSEIAGRAHALVSLAGQLRFKELSRLCAEVEIAARDGMDTIPIGEVRSAADRAIRAARRSRFARAA